MKKLLGVIGILALAAALLPAQGYADFRGPFAPVSAGNNLTTGNEQPAIRPIDADGIMGMITDGNKLIEDQAHRFAAAFLTPADEIRGELPSAPAWPELLILKRRWGVSIGALLMRARTLAVMPQSTYQQAVRYMSMRGWRTSEPGNLGAGHGK